MLNDVPQSAQTLGTTQPLIRTNFSTIDTAFSVDHVSYNLGGQGKHNKVTFPVQGSAPSFLAGEFGLYNFGGALVVANSAGALGNLTGGLITATGWSYWPTGALVKWGQITSGAGGVQTFSASQGPAFTNQYAMQLTNASVSTATTFTLVTLGPANGFTINISDLAGGAFQYFIIGK